jgi:hypothetical protein
VVGGVGGGGFLLVTPSGLKETQETAVGPLFHFFSIDDRVMADLGDPGLPLLQVRQSIARPQNNNKKRDQKSNVRPLL